MDNANPQTKAPTPDSAPAPIAADEIDRTGQNIGEFRLLHRLGRGGMGMVYLAEQTALKRKVALKLLNPELASNERTLQRFKAEAENVARATHANIVQIYTIGQAGGVHFIALEYVEGKNLREFIEKKGTPELALGLHVMTQVASALQRAGELGIIHRDIKPENILLTKKGEVKVADFGLSRCFAEANPQPSLTQSQVTMGTPLYMSPEQVERGNVDSRTDIYSFGVTCYHMFAGTPPFKGTSPFDVAYQHVHKEPQPLAEVRPDLPTELCGIIQKMMAKKPEERYQTAREIVRDINRLCEALNIGAAAVSLSASFLGNSAEAMRNSATKTWPGTPEPAPIWLRLLLVGCVLAALAGGGAIAWNQHAPVTNTKDPGVSPGQLPEDPLLAKSQDPRERERELLQRVEEYLAPKDKPSLAAGVKFCEDLGLFYLKNNRLDAASQFFAKISDPELKIPAYRLLGRIGQAAVLAFKDEAEASNEKFLTLVKDFDRFEKKLPKSKKEQVSEEIEAYGLVWKHNVQVREMVAGALRRNQANHPDLFAEKGRFEPLRIHLSPPTPVLRPVPASPVPANP